MGCGGGHVEEVRPNEIEAVVLKCFKVGWSVV